MWVLESSGSKTVSGPRHPEHSMTWRNSIWGFWVVHADYCFLPLLISTTAVRFKLNLQMIIQILYTSWTSVYTCPTLSYEMKWLLCTLFFFLTLADATLISTNMLIKAFAVSRYRKVPRNSLYQNGLSLLKNVEWFTGVNGHILLLTCYSTKASVEEQKGCVENECTCLQPVKRCIENKMQLSKIA